MPRGRIPPHGSPAERFRRRLQGQLSAAQRVVNREGQRTGRASTARQLSSILQTLINDFDRIFDNRMPPAVQRDVEEYCYSDPTVCPICGKALIQRRGKYGDFLGCCDYPNCHGGRKVDGTASMNEALREHLYRKRLEASQSSVSNTNRFSDLEI